MAKNGNGNNDPVSWYKNVSQKLMDVIGLLGIVCLFFGFMFIGYDGAKNYTGFAIIMGFILVGVFSLHVVLNAQKYFGMGDSSMDKLGNVDARKVHDTAIVTLKQEKEELLRRDKRDKLKTLIRELDHVNNYGMLNNVVNRVSEDIKSTSASVRVSTAKYMKELTPVIKNLKNKETYMNLNQTFIETETKETNKEAYFQLADLIEEGFEWHLEKGMLNKPREILGMFSEHKKMRDSQETSDRARWASSILRRLAGKKYTTILVEALRGEDEKRQREAYALILRISQNRSFWFSKSSMAKLVESAGTELAKDLAGKIRTAVNE